MRTPIDTKHGESPNCVRSARRQTHALNRDNFQLIVALHLHGWRGTLLPLIHCMFIQQIGAFMGQRTVISKNNSFPKIRNSGISP